MQFHSNELHLRCKQITNRSIAVERTQPKPMKRLRLFFKNLGYLSKYDLAAHERPLEKASSELVGATRPNGQMNGHRNNIPANRPKCTDTLKQGDVYRDEDGCVKIKS